MITTPWADLPNAQHIDTVLADVKARPEVWAAARAAALDAAWAAARAAALDAAWAAARAAARDAARQAAWDAAGYAAWDAILALIAWDEAGDLVDLSPDALRTLMDVAAPPVCHQAALLLPWAVVREAT